jgi:hypothetical protein
MLGSSAGSEILGIEPNQLERLGVLWRRIVDLVLTLGVCLRDNAAFCTKHAPAGSTPAARSRRIDDLGEALKAHHSR